jgi:hypothetical protein
MQDQFGSIDDWDFPNNKLLYYHKARNVIPSLRQFPKRTVVTRGKIFCRQLEMNERTGYHGIPPGCALPCSASRTALQVRRSDSRLITST